MEGARRAASRNVGVLNAYCSFADLGNSLPRPRSSPLAEPMSWNEESVKAQPLWQATQLALLLNRSNPRWAASPIAFLSPAIQRSKGASPETIERSNVASASSTFLRVKIGRASCRERV